MLMRTRRNPNAAWPKGVAIFGWLGTLIAIGAILANCGGGSRQLIAIAVQPSNGDAVAPTGTLPFTATGTFNQPPTTANLSGKWTSSNSSLATIDPNSGFATCVAVGGPITITASAPGIGGTVSGSATLNCLAHPRSKMGHCQILNNVLTGSCIGLRGEICMGAYDPSNCPPGQPPTGETQFQCSGEKNVDGSRECIP